jgi:hypothetical protein
LRQGFNGAYKFRAIQLMDGSTTYGDKPEKNKWADVHDSLQYCAQAIWRFIEKGRLG